MIIVAVAFLIIVLLGCAWLLLTPLTLCIDTNQPTATLRLALRGVLNSRFYWQGNGFFCEYRILFFSSKKNMFDGKRRVIKRKKKPIEKNNTRSLNLGCKG